MTDIIDQTSDAGFATLRVIAEEFPALRKMSKTAELDEDEFSALPDSAFAWPAQRKFPIHNAEHTALSMGYRKHASAVPAEVDMMLAKAAQLYGVDLNIFKAPEKLEKTAGEMHWLLKDKQRFLVKCAADVPVAERVLHQRYQQMGIEDRAEAMHNLVKVARYFGVDLSPSTHKLAGFTLTSTQTFRDWIEARKEAATKLGSALSGAYEKLAEEYREVEPIINDRDHQVKLAELVHELDQRAGLEQFYGKSLPDPIQTVFNTKKIAADQVDINGVLFDKAVLGSIPLSFWEDTLGADIAKEVAPGGVVDAEVLAQVLPTLPQDLKAALATQLAPYNR
jgi:hypothetical protein